MPVSPQQLQKKTIRMQQFSSPDGHLPEFQTIPTNDDKPCQQSLNQAAQFQATLKSAYIEFNALTLNSGFYQ